jgi:hypothetical protein
MEAVQLDLDESCSDEGTRWIAYRGQTKHEGHYGSQEIVRSTSVLIFDPVAAEASEEVNCRRA